MVPRRQEVGTAYAWKTPTGTKKKPILTSALPLILDGPSFPRLLAGSARVRLSLALGETSCLYRHGLYQKHPLDMFTDLGCISNRKWLIHFNVSFGRRDCSLRVEEDISSWQNNRI